MRRCRSRTAAHPEQGASAHQLVGALHGVMEDLDEGLDHRLEGGDVVVPHDDGPEILGVEELVDVRVVDDRMVDGGLVVEDEGHGSFGKLRPVSRACNWQVPH